MAEWKYSDFIHLKEDFIPVYTLESDKKYKDAWKSFIPHDQMENLLQTILNALDRNSAKVAKSIWVHGSYGTGKTFASFVVKHLFEDDIEEVKEYLNSHKKIEKLKERLNIIRSKGDNIFIYKSAAGHIEKQSQFYIELQKEIYDELTKRRYKIPQKTIVEEIISKLESGIVNGQELFRKHINKFPQCSDIDDVKREMKAGNKDVIKAVVEAFNEENLVYLAFAPDKVKEWIKEIFNKNKNIASIFFIWDEFTSYLENSTLLEALQEIAHLTAEVPFYMYIITHKSPEQFESSSSSFLKVRDRFHFCHLEMEPVTAIELLKNIVRPVSDKEKDWLKKRFTLESDIGSLMRSDIFNDPDLGIKKQDLIELFPIHPYTALLLSEISRNYSSSQRTLFQFIKDSESGFLKFIQEYPANEKFWLTADFLWDYFFIKTNEPPESSSSVELINHYKKHSEDINDEGTLKVFKVALLLNFLSESSIGLSSRTTSRITPNITNIRLAFKGEEWLDVESAVEELTKKEILRKTGKESDSMLIIPHVVTDREKLEEIISELKNKDTLSELLSGKIYDLNLGEKLEELLNLNNAEKLRYQIDFISVKGSSPRRFDKIELKPYKIGLIIFLPINTDEYNRAIEIAKQLNKDILGQEARLFLAVSAPVFSEWEKFIEKNLAYYLYFAREVKDSKQAQSYKHSCEEYLRKWCENIQNAKFTLFKGEEKYETVNSLKGLRDFLNEQRAKIFNFAPEEFELKDTLYTPSHYGQKDMKVALEIDKPTGKHKELHERVKNMEKNKDHLLIQLKDMTSKFFEKEEGHLSSIWLRLQERPIGLMPCGIGAYLFAYLMKDYIKGYYFIDENKNSQSLNEQTLANILEKTMKNNIDKYQIRSLSVEAEEFCKILKLIFNLTEEESSFPEILRNSLRNKINTMLLYPIWSALYYNDNSEFRDPIALICEFISFEDHHFDNKFYEKAVESIKEDQHRLRSLFTPNILSEGFKNFLYTSNPHLKDISTYFNLSPSALRDEISKLLPEDSCFWTEDKVKEAAEKLKNKLEASKFLMKITKESTYKYEVALEKTAELLQNFKLPIYLIPETDLIDAFNSLIKLVEDESLVPDVNILDVLRNQSESLAELLQDPKKYLIKIVKSLLDIELTMEESEEIYRSMPNMRDLKDKEEVKKQLLNEIEKIEKRRKIKLIKETWKAITNSNSPEELSKSLKLPIKWIIDVSDFERFVDYFDRIDHASLDECDFMLSFLEISKNYLANLTDTEWVNRQFLRLILPKYSEIITTKQIERLKDFIIERLGADVHHYSVSGMRKIDDLVNEWLKENAKEVVDKVKSYFEKYPNPENLKRKLSNLVTKDFTLAMKIYAYLKEED